MSTNTTPKNDIVKGLSVPSQFELNTKLYFKTLDEMKDLGLNNNLAYTYYEGMEVFCLETFKKYYWANRLSWQPKIMPYDFIYPNNTISNGIDYSNRGFNFIDVDSISYNNEIDKVPVYLNNYNKINGVYYFKVGGLVTMQNILYSANQLATEYPISLLFPNADVRDLIFIVEVYKNDLIIIQKIINIRKNTIYQRIGNASISLMLQFTDWELMNNVQSDWDQADNSKNDFIKNKPTIPTAVQSDWNQGNNQALDFIKNKPTIPTPVPQIQSDWNQTNVQSLDFIKNKPNIPSSLGIEHVINIGSWNMLISNNIYVNVISIFANNFSLVQKVKSISGILFLDGNVNNDGVILKLSKSRISLHTKEVANTAYIHIVYEEDTPLFQFSDDTMNRGKIFLQFTT